MFIQCTDVWLRFRDNRNGQHITLGDGPTVTKTMALMDNGDRITVAFFDAENKGRKFISWPIEVVLEYAIEGSNYILPKAETQRTYPPHRNGG